MLMQQKILCLYNIIDTSHLDLRNHWNDFLHDYHKN